MSHLSVATVIEKNKIASDVAFVPCVEIDVRDPVTGNVVETLRLVRNSEDLEYNGHTYAASAFDFNIVEESGAQPDIQVVFKDYSRAVQARMQAYGGGVGFTVRLMVVNAGNLSQPPEGMETFEVVGATAKNYIVTFRLGAENPLTKRFPRRTQTRDRCRWVYKGPECGYTGSLGSCDYSLQGPNGCAAHNNTERFGGFPGIKTLS